MTSNPPSQCVKEVFDNEAFIDFDLESPSSAVELIPESREPFTYQDFCFNAGLYLCYIFGWGIIDNLVLLCISEEDRQYALPLAIAYTVLAAAAVAFLILCRWLWEPEKAPFHFWRAFDETNSFFSMVSVWGVFDFLFYVFCYPSDWKLGVTMMAVYGLFALTFYITYLVRRHMFGSRHILRDIYALMEE